MKTVILAGGLGTRLSEETEVRPKPMVEIGGKPILWHIMKTYSHCGFNDFVICLGYKGYMIKEWFSHYSLHNSDLSIDLKKNNIEILNNKTEDWKVTLVDTGKDTMTGGRLKRVKEYLDDETFMMTYGDGVGDIDIKSLVNFHKSHRKLATVTACNPEGRFGVIKLGGEKATSFGEKKDTDEWINAGFFVLEPNVLDYISGDAMPWEKDPLENLSKDGELMVNRHTGFWKPMDKYSDKLELERIWGTGKAPWKTW